MNYNKNKGRFNENINILNNYKNYKFDNFKLYVKKSLNLKLHSFYFDVVFPYYSYHY